MAESHVISALAAKRSELAGQINFHKAEIAKLTQEIKMLSDTIKLFDPEYNVQTIKTKHLRKNNAFFSRNEAGRIILDFLRLSDKPVSTNEIARSVMDSKGIDPKQRQQLQATILNTLHKLKKKGLIKIESIDKRNSYLWVLLS